MPSRRRRRSRLRNAAPPARFDMDQADLARRSVVSTDTIADFENGSRIPAANTLAAIRAALEFAGVIFIDGDEPGVKLRKRRR
jgi:transcriptional regulator with XRE-family HTH domain